MYWKSRNRDTDIENKCMDQGEKREGGMSWETQTDIHISLCIKYKVDNYENLLFSTGNSIQCSVLT